jgi:hypothetical protein
MRGYSMVGYESACFSLRGRAMKRGMERGSPIVRFLFQQMVAGQWQETKFSIPDHFSSKPGSTVFLKNYMILFETHAYVFMKMAQPSSW